MGELLQSASATEHDLKPDWDWTQPLRPFEASLMRCSTEEIHSSSDDGYDSSDEKRRQA